MDRGFTFNGMDDYIKQLRALEDNVDDVATKALEEAGKIMTDELREEVKKIPERQARNGSGKLRGLLKSDKDDILANLGTTPVKKGRNDEINIKSGFYGGYGRRKTKKWVRGIPVQLTAAAINKGTAWLQSYPFVRKAIRKAQDQAESKISEVFDHEIELKTKK